MEKWKTINPLVGYSVSPDGKIKNDKTGNILKPNICSGYMGVTIRPHGRKSKAIRLRIHRVIAEAYLEGYFYGAYVNHKDGNKLNNSLDNLEWVTFSENVKHAYKTGLIKQYFGMDRFNNKITDDEVKFIRANRGIYTNREFAEMFSVHHSTIYAILSMKTHKNVK